MCQFTRNPITRSNVSYMLQYFPQCTVRGHADDTFLIFIIIYSSIHLNFFEHNNRVQKDIFLVSYTLLSIQESFKIYSFSNEHILNFSFVFIHLRIFHLFQYFSFLSICYSKKKHENTSFFLLELSMPFISYFCFKNYCFKNSSSLQIIVPKLISRSKAPASTLLSRFKTHISFQIIISKLMSRFKTQASFQIFFRFKTHA